MLRCSVTCERYFQFPGFHVNCICKRNACPSSSSTVYTGSGDSIAHCYDAKSGAIRRVFRGHESAVNTMQVCDWLARFYFNGGFFMMDSCTIINGWANTSLCLLMITMAK